MSLPSKIKRRSQRLSTTEIFSTRLGSSLRHDSYLLNGYTAARIDLSSTRHASPNDLSGSAAVRLNEHADFFD